MAQSIAKGDIALTVDELELEASLRFTPDPNGAEWSGEKILRLVMDAKIGGLNQKRADEIVGKFSRSRSAVTEIVAKGQPPVEPRLEEVEWAELEVPPEWTALVEESLKAAAEPELYLLRSEVVRTEKTVKKPGALPFLPPKIEKVVVNEKREKRERVYPDLNIVKTGYARRGERLGLLCLAQPGKAGKTIFGKPLQPAGADAEPTFVLGPGLERRKTELFAEREGILRAGARWAEILPFGAHNFAVEKAQDGATYFLDYRPGDRRLPAPKALEILAKAAELGAPEGSLLGEEELDRALAAAAAKGEPLFALPLSLDRDGRAEVAVSPDGARATLSLWKGRGRGKPLELAAVTAALKAAALKGVKSEQLKKDVLEFHKGPTSELLDYLLVEGSPPVRGKDRTIGLSLSFLPDDKAAELRRRILAHPALSQTASRLDEFPIDEAARFAFVQAGQRLGELSAASPGQPGLDVRGAVLPGIPGNDPIVKLYEGVELSRGVLAATGAGLFIAAEREGAWRFRVLP
ncbi:MAG: DUF342 domain-containing protein, partial [Spirochaetaceae bacterium]|nr:DUF342 domain-containing protein [Spirochaetaceae bacterium]